MGELAEMMIEGAMCPCGEYLGEGPGFPQFCSRDCAASYGGETEGEPRRPERALRGLWLRLAENVHEGRTTVTDLAEAIGFRNENLLAEHVEKMKLCRLLSETGGHLALTKRGSKQMEAGHA